MGQATQIAEMHADKEEEAREERGRERDGNRDRDRDRERRGERVDRERRGERVEQRRDERERERARPYENERGRGGGGRMAMERDGPPGVRGPPGMRGMGGMREMGGMGKGMGLRGPPIGMERREPTEPVDRVEVRPAAAASASHPSPLRRRPLPLGVLQPGSNCRLAQRPEAQRPRLDVGCLWRSHRGLWWAWLGQTCPMLIRMFPAVGKHNG
eukprot:SAG11_NODE_3691_length_2277_cov_1.927456_1_plen_214_part_00